jgi:phytoene dehydrogenase-like protein
MKHLDVLYSVENPLFKNLKKDWDYLFRKLLPWLPKFLFTVGVVNYLNKPVENYLRGFMLNQSLIDIISQHFFRGTPTCFALSYFSLYLDYFYPKGGVGKLAESLVEKMGEYHGELLPNTTIEKVCIRNKRVADSQGNDYHFHNLIWASDLKAFYQSVNSDDLDENVKSKFEVEKLKVLQKKGAESVFTLFLEVDLPLDYFRNISHGHFFYTPSKIGLNETHTTELDALMTNWRQVRKEDVLNWLDRFLRLNTFEISIPGLKDETLVPLGKTGLIISFLSRFEIFRIIQEDGWYVEFRNAIEEKLIDRVCL